MHGSNKTYFWWNAAVRAARPQITYFVRCFLKQNKSGQNQQQARRFDQDNPLRISIMVTDPDGMEVNSSVYKAGRLETEVRYPLLLKQTVQGQVAHVLQLDPLSICRTGRSHVDKETMESSSDAQERKTGATTLQETWRKKWKFTWYDLDFLLPWMLAVWDTVTKRGQAVGPPLQRG